MHGMNVYIYVPEIGRQLKVARRMERTVGEEVEALADAAARTGGGVRLEAAVA